jgi:FAD/FMN-containing dehydrogenase
VITRQELEPDLGRRLDRRTFLLASLAFAAAPRVAWAAKGDPRLRELAAAVRGPVLTRSSSGYAAARLVYNERFDGVHPLAVVQCANAGDVSATLRWAQRHHVPVAARCGGHSYAGYSTTRGVVLDLGRLKAVSVNRARGRVAVGGGARLIDVYSALAAHGATIPAGSCPSVGVAGLTLGGGIGFAARKLGTTADNLESLAIVTADGRHLTCDARRHADLFWACRGGGGGNFGVVTSFVFRVHPVSSAAYFVLTWPWDAVEDALAAWQTLLPGAPDELFSIFRVATGGAQPTAQAIGQFFGTETALRSLLAPLAAVGPAKLQTGTESYLDLVRRWAGCKALGVDQCRVAPAGALARDRFLAKSDYVATPLPGAARAAVRAWLERRQSAGEGSLLLDSYGGAINRVSPHATAFVHRDQLFACQYHARSAGPADDAATLAWLRGFHAALRPYTSGQAYQNYIDPDLGAWAQAYYGSNYPRLRHVKARYDPHDLFRFPQSVRPKR